MLQLSENFVVPIVQGNVEMVDLIVLYNVSDLHLIWFVNLLYVFGVVSLKHVIMLWLGHITKNGGKVVTYVFLN